MARESRKNQIQNVHKMQVAVGVVGGNAGERHVANVSVGGWDGERRRVQRGRRELSPLSLYWRCTAAVREVGAVWWC